MILKSDERYWTDRYREGATGWDIGYASTPIVHFVDRLQDRSLRILVPGAGYGHEVLYLQEQAFKHVTVVDLSPLPIDRLRKELEDDSYNLIVGDFFDHQGEYDLILEQTFFCAIDPIRRSQYVQYTYDLLADGGKLCGVLFDTNFEGRPGPPHGGSAEAYRERFSKVYGQVLIHPCENSIPPRAGKECWIEAVRTS